MSLDLLQNPQLDPDLKNSLVEVLFDYRPGEWYSREAPAPKPPSETKLPSEARDLLKKIAAAVAEDSAISTENKNLVVKAISADATKKGNDSR
jgi:hypothetical protein